MTGFLHKKWRYYVYAAIMGIVMAVLIAGACREEGPEGWYLWAAIGAAVLAVVIMLMLPPSKVTKGARAIPRILINLLTIVLSPFLAVMLLQNFTLDPFRIYPLMLVANCVFFYLIYLFLSFATGSWHVGYLIADWLFLLLGVVNYFVVAFRGSPVVPWDLFSIRTAASVANNYTYSVTWRFVFSAFGFFYLAIFAMKLTWKIRSIPVRIIGAAAALGLTVLCTLELQKDSVKEMLGMDTTLFTPNVRYRNNGFLAAFLGNLHLINVQEPAGYSVSATERISDEIGAEHANDPQVHPAALAEGEMPNIIVIIDEAFSDLAVLGDFRTDIDYMPNFRKMMEQCDSGNLMVSVKGGNTANTEYEFLSGDTMAFLPSGSVVFQQFIRDNIPVLPSYLASLGYTTTGIHPYLATGWNRDTVYPLLGFQDFLSSEDFVNPKRIRDFISDESAFDKIIEEYEKGNAAGDKPQFLYEVTMQNHSGYSKEYPGFEEEVHLQGLGYENVQTKAVNKYLTLIYESDKALGRLMEYFENVTEPTVIVMFGDHEPSDYITNVIERMTGYDPEQSLEEAQKAYLVPYFIWNNFGMDLEDRPLTSVNYLAADILEGAGIPLTRYHEFLLDLQDALPVVCAGVYVDAAGVYHSYSEEDSPYEDMLNRYNILQYNHMIDIKKRVTELFGKSAASIEQETPATETQ